MKKLKDMFGALDVYRKDGTFDKRLGYFIEIGRLQVWWKVGA